MITGVHPTPPPQYLYFLSKNVVGYRIQSAGCGAAIAPPANVGQAMKRVLSVSMAELYAAMIRGVVLELARFCVTPVPAKWRTRMCIMRYHKSNCAAAYFFTVPQLAEHVLYIVITGVKGFF